MTTDQAPAYLDTDRHGSTRRLIEWALKCTGYEGVDVTVQWNRRFTSRMGDAMRTGHRSGRIRLSVPLWPQATDEQRRQTILHEVAHVIANIKLSDQLGRPASAKHGPIWKAVMSQLGVSASRCHSVKANDRADDGSVVARTFTVGDTVRFGRERGERTRAKIIGIVHKRNGKVAYRLLTLEPRRRARGRVDAPGMVWTAPASTMTPESVDQR